MDHLQPQMPLYGIEKALQEGYMLKAFEGGGPFVARIEKPHNRNLLIYCKDPLSFKYNLNDELYLKGYGEGFNLDDALLAVSENYLSGKDTKDFLPSRHLSSEELSRLEWNICVGRKLIAVSKDGIATVALASHRWEPYLTVSMPTFYEAVNFLYPIKFERRMEEMINLGIVMDVEREAKEERLTGKKAAPYNPAVCISPDLQPSEKNIFEGRKMSTAEKDSIVTISLLSYDNVPILSVSQPTFSKAAEILKHVRFSKKMEELIRLDMEMFG